MKRNGKFAGIGALAGAAGVVMILTVFLGARQGITQPPGVGAERTAAWRAVEQAERERLPRTALGHLETIIPGAIGDRAWAEAARALGLKIVLESGIEGDGSAERIKRLEAALEDVPAEMGPVLEALLAHWYRQYFQENRWRFMQRTRMAEPAGEDIETWDLPRILAEVDRRFQQALEKAAELRAVPVGEFALVMEEGSAPDELRPTLHDFLAWEAISFYSAGEHAANLAADAFVLAAESPVFAPVEDFLAWNLPPGGPESPELRALAIFQDLLLFHREADAKAALADADFHRLRFGFDQAAGESVAERYAEALERHVAETGDHPLAARSLHELANRQREAGDLVKARETALRGARRFPESIGGQMCRNLVSEIEAPSLDISSERSWASPLTTIDVRYRNIREIHFRVLPFDWDEWAAGGGPLPEHRHPLEDEISRLVGRRPVLAWSENLEPTPDYQDRKASLAVPGDLGDGSYILLSSAREDFRAGDNHLSLLAFQVTGLALVIRRNSAEPGVIEGFVLEAESGEPVPGAGVTAWTSAATGRHPRPRTPSLTAETGENGLFRLEMASPTPFLLSVSSDGRRAVSFSVHHMHGGRARVTPAREETVFFTDRALYRPGQVVRYKGLSISVDRENDDYRVIPDREVEIALRDPNGREIERMTHRTNDHGSFSGSFSAPRGTVTGRMTIRVVSGPAGTASFSVEEYKRPTFRVEVETPDRAAALGEEVTVKGAASAYTGAPVDGASVSWRVFREVRFPPWVFWRRPWWPFPTGQGQEIASGTMKTSHDGGFAITFTARPDPAVKPSDEPVFRFTVHAEVTDPAGETRTASQTVSVGYRSLEATLAAADWLVAGEAVKVTVNTRTLDGKPEPAAGTLSLHRLVEPGRVARAALGGRPGRPVPFPRMMPGVAVVEDEDVPDWSDPKTWPTGDKIGEYPFRTGADGLAERELEVEAGLYRLVLETSDGGGRTVRSELNIHVLDPAAETFPAPLPHFFRARETTLQPGQEFLALWGSGYESARAFVEIEHRGRIVESWWTEPGKTQRAISLEVSEAMRGGFTVYLTMVRENRAYLETCRVSVPWENKNLEVTWERFTSKLSPGQEVVWSALVRGPDGEATAAEMVAALYDASLDAFLPHGWPERFTVFRQEGPRLSMSFENNLQNARSRDDWKRDHIPVSPYTYRRFLDSLVGRRHHFAVMRRGGTFLDGDNMVMAAAPMMMEEAADKAETVPGEGGAPPAPAPPSVDLDRVDARENLEETAFFKPALVSGDDGVVRLEFRIPEALTEWNFLGFAHDRELRSGSLRDSAVTSKDLMVRPNPPRFLREGDEVEFTVRVINRSPTRQAGRVRLSFSDPVTGAGRDEALDNLERERDFDIPAGESRAYAWKIRVPREPGILVYRAVGSSGRLSDGEEGYLPVLTSRIMLTESLPLPVHGPGRTDFDFRRLAGSDASNTLEHRTLGVQMASNPAWYAVMALPYLMEYPHRSADNIFNRLYANSLARQIANSDPRIRRVFNLWRDTDALESPLEKNEDLKSVVLEETPWWRQAADESRARRNVGILFDHNRLNEETAVEAAALAALQSDEGGWPWFPGGRTNPHVTLSIVTGYGRLRHLGVEIDIAPALRALNYLDRRVRERHDEIHRRGNPEENNLSPEIALYLYARTFFLADAPPDAGTRRAIDYFLGQGRQYWTKLAGRQNEAQLALALHRSGDRETPRAIIRSLRERSLSDPLMGIYWREGDHPYRWNQAPIETQAYMIELFDEVAGDARAVEDLKAWLLWQKQAQDWKTTRATADAVYALLMRGDDLLSSTGLTTVSLGGRELDPGRVEPGTGFWEHRVEKAEIGPALARVTVNRNDPGIAWGAVHWQYLEEMENVTAASSGPLSVEKEFFVRATGPTGPELRPVRGPLAPGDELVARVILRSDRDMDYVHLKDYRGSGVEPTGVLSGHRWQDGLGYYESTRDVATHYFFDRLPRGTYVFEQAGRVQLRGRYQAGPATVQCLYAPEFNAHTAGIPILVE